jgi:predicted  nucleic acid-binding Zn-ribbon protein
MSLTNKMISNNTINNDQKFNTLINNHTNINNEILSIQQQIKDLKNIYVSHDVLTNMINELNDQLSNTIQTPRTITNSVDDIINLINLQDNKINDLQKSMNELNNHLLEHEQELNNLIVKTNGLESKLINVSPSEKPNIPKINIRKTKQ